MRGFAPTCIGGLTAQKSGASTRDASATRQGTSGLLATIFGDPQHWSPPTAGTWRFLVWGAGGQGSGQLSSGAYAAGQAVLAVSDSVYIVTGQTPTQASYVQLPNGQQITAQGGNQGAPPKGSGGDEAHDGVQGGTGGSPYLPPGIQLPEGSFNGYAFGVGGVGSAQASSGGPGFVLALRVA